MPTTGEAPQRRPRTQPVWRDPGRPHCATTASSFFGAYQGTPRHADTGRHHRVRPDRGDAGRRLHAGGVGGLPAQGALDAAAPVREQPLIPRCSVRPRCKIAQQLPTTTDPCGRITYSRQTKPREAQTIGKVDWQVRQKHSFFGRYILTTTFWDPAYANSPEQRPCRDRLGRRTRQHSHSLAIGDTMVLSNTIVNNLRVPTHRTKCTGRTRTSSGQRTSA